MSFSLKLASDAVQQSYLTDRKKNPSLPEWSGVKGILKEYAKLFFHQEATVDETINYILSPENEDIQDPTSRILEGAKLCHKKILQAQDKNTTLSYREVREIKNFFNLLQVPAGYKEEDREKLEHKFKIIRETTPYLIKISESFVSSLNQFESRFEEHLLNNGEPKAFNKALREYKDRIFPAIPHTRAALAKLKESQKPCIDSLPFEESLKKVSLYFTALFLSEEPKDEFRLVKETLDELCNKMAATKRVQQSNANIHMIKQSIEHFVTEHKEKIAALETKNQSILKKIEDFTEEFIVLDAEQQTVQKDKKHFKNFSHCVKGIPSNELEVKELKETLEKNRELIDRLNNQHSAKLAKINAFLEDKIKNKKELLENSKLKEELLEKEVITDHDLAIFKNLIANPHALMEAYKVYATFLSTKINRSPEFSYWLIDGWF